MGEVEESGRDVLAHTAQPRGGRLQQVPVAVGVDAAPARRTLHGRRAQRAVAHAAASGGRRNAGRDTAAEIEAIGSKQVICLLCTAELCGVGLECLE